MTTNWKIRRDGNNKPPYLSPEKPVCRSRSNRTQHEIKDWFKSGKEYIKSVYCYPAYLTYMQNISYEMPGWMNHKLELRFLGEISTTSDIQMILFCVNLQNGGVEGCVLIFCENSKIATSC